MDWVRPLVMVAVICGVTAANTPASAQGLLDIGKNLLKGGGDSSGSAPSAGGALLSTGEIAGGAFHLDDVSTERPEQPGTERPRKDACQIDNSNILHSSPSRQSRFISTTLARGVARTVSTMASAAAGRSARSVI